MFYDRNLELEGLELEGLHLEVLRSAESPRTFQAGTKSRRLSEFDARRECSIFAKARKNTVRPLGLGWVALVN